MQRLLPAGYGGVPSSYGDANKGSNKDAAAAGASAATGLLSAGATAAAVGGPVGWIIGGTMVGAAGITALVFGIRNGKVNRAAAIKWARKLGLPDAQDVPGFVVKLAKKDKAWQRKRLSREKAKLKKIKKRQRKWKKKPGGQRTAQVLTFGIKRGPKRLKAQRKRVETRIALIEALWQTRKERHQTRQEKARVREMEKTAAVQEQAADVAQADAVTVSRGKKILGTSAVVGLILVGVAVYIGTRRTK